MKAEHKYAPQSLSEVIFVSQQTQTIVQGYASGQLDGHLLLWGPNGTGKSTLANLLPKLIGGEDASVETKTYEELMAMTDIRDYFRNTVQLNKLTGQGKHFVIFHEFDENSGKQAKLWTAIEGCLSDVMLIITTNHPMKINSSIRSRCDCIEMPAITPELILPRVQDILRTEGLDLPDQQVMYYLVNQVVLRDVRKYMGLIDKLLYLHSQGQALPAWKPSAPVLVKA